MRVYIHFEVTQPEFTLPVTLEAGDSRVVSDFKDLFIAAYAKRHGVMLDSASFVLANSKKRPLAASQSLIALAKPNDDIFMVTPSKMPSGSASTTPVTSVIKSLPGTQKRESAGAVSTVPAAAAAARRPVSQLDGQRTVPESTHASSDGKAATNTTNRPSTQLPVSTSEATSATWVRPVLAEEPKNPQVEVWLEQSLGVARELKEKGALRQACQAWRQILAVAPGRIECAEGLAETAAAAGRHQEAIDFWCQAVAHMSKPAPALLVSIGKSSHALGDHSSALVFYNRAMEARLALKSTDECDDVKVLIGRSLYASGNQDAAIQLYTNVLQREESNVLALLEYAKAYIDRNRVSEALKILLRVLVLESTSKEAREEISRIVKGPGGLGILYQELGDAAKSGAALAFMATLIKDYGATEESAALYYKAMDATPEMTTYVLNLVHTLEVQNKYEEALDVALAFCRRFPDMGVGKHFFNKQVTERITDISDLRSERFRVADHPNAHPGTRRTVRWIPNYGAVVEDKPADGKPNESQGSTALPSPAAPSPAKGEQRLPPYSADELDLLALHFTICKILYVVGALALIPGVVEIINIKGEETVLIPKLVTGLKCYHLRPESMFFPKNNFYNVVASIPRGARVLFMFGEIDCREGILRAVEKTRYSDVEEGLRTTVGFYLDALDALARKQALAVHVQPVAPVLNETREVVKAFNATLKESVARVPGLTFLDVMDQLLTPDGDALHPDFEMDGTHMGPKYVRVLEGALNKL